MDYFKKNGFDRFLFYRSIVSPFDVSGFQLEINQDHGWAEICASNRYGTALYYLPFHEFAHAMLGVVDNWGGEGCDWYGQPSIEDVDWWDLVESFGEEQNWLMRRFVSENFTPMAVDYDTMLSMRPQFFIQHFTHVIGGPDHAIPLNYRRLRDREEPKSWEAKDFQKLADILDVAYNPNTGCYCPALWRKNQENATRLKLADQRLEKELGLAKQ